MGVGHGFLAGILGLVTLVVPPLLVSPVAGAAAPGDVVISEIHYKPASGSGEEFVELTNIGVDSIDISGWCFTDGFVFCFGSTTTLAGGARVVVTGSLTDFQATYGFAAGHQITSGGISNGGETIDLRNAVGDLVDTVAYDDEGLWPGAPDGNGPSLELTDLAADNADPSVWGPSLVDGGTPSEVNSIDGGVPGPQITNLTVTPFRPSPNEAIVVDAAVAGAISVELEYVVNFGAPQTMAMTDLGASAYTATIPGQAAGDLVRYKIVTSDGANLITDPATTDTINYHGVVVLDPDLSSNAPIVEWFIDEADYADMFANHRYDDMTFYAAFSHDGVVIDNATIRVRGGGTRDNPKPNFKVDFPDGHLFFIPGQMEYPVDEFNMQWNASGRVAAAWAAAAESGNPEVEAFAISTQRNGNYWGIGMYVEPLDGRWRANNGYDTGAFYKGAPHAFLKTEPTPADLEDNFDKKTRDSEDYTDLWELTQALALPNGQEQFDYLIDNVDISSVVNYMALRVLIRQYDARAHNYYIYRDTEGTGRWEMLLWDLDDVLKDPASDGQATLLRPSEYGTELEKVLLQYPDIEAMMFRRVRTLADEFLNSTFFEDVYYALDDPNAAEIDASVKMWSWGRKTLRRTQEFEEGLQARRDLIDHSTRSVGPPIDRKPIPRSQAASAPIVVTELHPDPSGLGVEFVEITNTSTTESFDLTGWTLDGAGSLTIPQGTVILPGKRIAFVSDDTAFREIYPPVQVGGEFTGSLSDSGELIELFDAAGTLVDAVNYSTTAPWPAVVGTGRSLSLIDTGLDNADPVNWGVSLGDGGSPGEANVIDPDPPASPVADGVVLLNEWNAVAADKQLKDGGSDPTFGQAVGNGGDWFELVVADDGVDLSGWELRWSEAGGPSSGTLTLVSDPLWASLPAGMIVTVSEDQPDDLSFDPVNGDWSINVQAPGALVTGSFDVTNDDWQLTVVDDSGVVSFGAAGEGISTGGVGSTEVGALLDDPSPLITPVSNYDDLAESSWGSANSDGAGGTQDFSALRILAPPTISSGPLDATVQAGEGAMFVVDVSGTSPYTFEWRRDGVVIPGAVSATLTLESVEPSDDGSKFELTVLNAFGSISSEQATLTVQEVPVGITVEGDPTVTVIEGIGQLDVTWEPVDGARLYQLRYQLDGETRRVWDTPTTDMARTLTGLTAGLAHTVEVRAYTTSWGPFTTVRAVPLEVDPGPLAPSFLLEPVDVSVTAGADVFFTVQVSGSPAPLLQWRRDGADLVGETGLALMLENLVLDDSGATFDVVATSSSGAATSAVATLTVQEAPVGITVEGDPTVTVVEGVGQLGVSWEPFDGARLYQLRYQLDGATRRVWDTPTTDMARTLTGLTSGLAHTVQVRAYTTTWGPFTTVQATPN